MTGLWIEFSAMIVNEPFKATILGIAVIILLIVGLALLKMSCPSRTFEFKTIGKLLNKIISFMCMLLTRILLSPLYLLDYIRKVRHEHDKQRAELIEEAAKKLIGELPKVEIRIRTINEYTYCYDCDIHFNEKLPECPNCFAKNLAEGDAKAIFGILKGVREFRYLSFDREQDLIKLISEKMVGEPADGPEEKY